MLIRSTPTRHLSAGRAARGLGARLGVCSLVVIGAALASALAMPALASATPTVSIKAKIVPIPGFPGTGNCLGCGADAESEIKISSTEYFGGPPPVTFIKGYFPKGTKINTKGFTTCPAQALERSGTAGCSSKAKAGPVSETHGFVSLGGERVRETVFVTPFYAPGGGLEFWIEGNTPTKIEKIAKGRWTYPSSGPVINVEVPLIESLPGAPDASAEIIQSKFGGAVKHNGKTIYGGTVPTSCPKGGFPIKLEVSFLNAGTADAETKVPCPPSKKKKHH
jgi:hypothetical protein